MILKIVGSNLVLQDKIVNIEAKKPFRFTLETTSLPQLRAVREDIRTLWVNKDPELLTILDDIRKLKIKLGIQSEEGYRLAA
jgi:hypothetical protein